MCEFRNSQVVKLESRGDLDFASKRVGEWRGLYEKEQKGVEIKLFLVNAALVGTSLVTGWLAWDPRAPSFAWTSIFFGSQLGWVTCVVTFHSLTLYPFRFGNISFSLLLAFPTVANQAEVGGKKTVINCLCEWDETALKDWNSVDNILKWKF